jgi:hypothetical protein
MKHLDQLRNKLKGCVLWAHCREHHQSSVVFFRMVLQINDFGGFNLNRHSAWRQPLVFKVKFTRDWDKMAQQLPYQTNHCNTTAMTGDYGLQFSVIFSFVMFKYINKFLKRGLRN